MRIDIVVAEGIVGVTLFKPSCRLGLCTYGLCTYRPLARLRGCCKTNAFRGVKLNWQDAEYLLNFLKSI
jgi:hypothetical protein